MSDTPFPTFDEMVKDQFFKDLDESKRQAMIAGWTKEASKRAREQLGDQYNPQELLDMVTAKTKTLGEKVAGKTAAITDNEYVKALGRGAAQILGGAYGGATLPTRAVGAGLKIAEQLTGLPVYPEKLMAVMAQTQQNYDKQLTNDVVSAVNRGVGSAAGALPMIMATGGLAGVAGAPKVAEPFIGMAGYSGAERGAAAVESGAGPLKASGEAAIGAAEGAMIAGIFRAASLVPGGLQTLSEKLPAGPIKSLVELAKRHPEMASRLTSAVAGTAPTALSPHKTEDLVAAAIINGMMGGPSREGTEPSWTRNRETLPRFNEPEKVSTTDWEGQAPSRFQRPTVSDMVSMMLEPPKQLMPATSEHLLPPATGAETFGGLREEQATAARKRQEDALNKAFYEQDQQRVERQAVEGGQRIREADLRQNQRLLTAKPFYQPASGMEGHTSAELWEAYQAKAAEEANLAKQIVPPGGRPVRGEVPSELDLARQREKVAQEQQRLDELRQRQYEVEQEAKHGKAAVNALPTFNAPEVRDTLLKVYPEYDNEIARMSGQDLQDVHSGKIELRDVEPILESLKPPEDRKPLPPFVNKTQVADVRASKKYVDLRHKGMTDSEAVGAVLYTTVERGKAQETANAVPVEKPSPGNVPQPAKAGEEVAPRISEPRPQEVARANPPEGVAPAGAELPRAVTPPAEPAKLPKDVVSQKQNFGVGGRGGAIYSATYSASDFGSERAVTVQDASGNVIGKRDPFWPQGIPTAERARKARISVVAREIVAEHEAKPAPAEPAPLASEVIDKPIIRGKFKNPSGVGVVGFEGLIVKETPNAFELQGGQIVRKRDIKVSKRFDVPNPLGPEMQRAKEIREASSAPAAPPREAETPGYERALELEREFGLEPADAHFFNVAIDAVDANPGRWSTRAEGIQKEAMRASVAAKGSLLKVASLKLAKQIGDRYVYRPAAPPREAKTPPAKLTPAEARKVAGKSGKAARAAIKASAEAAPVPVINEAAGTKTVSTPLPASVEKTITNKEAKPLLVNELQLVHDKAKSDVESSELATSVSRQIDVAKSGNRNVLRNLYKEYPKGHSEPEGAYLRRIYNEVVRTEARKNYGTVTVEVPGDGKFDIVNSREAIFEMMRRVEKLPATENAGTPRAGALPKLTDEVRAETERKPPPSSGMTTLEVKVPKLSENTPIRRFGRFMADKIGKPIRRAAAGAKPSLDLSKPDEINDLMPDFPAAEQTMQEALVKSGGEGVRGLAKIWGTLVDTDHPFARQLRQWRFQEAGAEAQRGRALETLRGRLNHLFPTDALGNIEGMTSRDPNASLKLTDVIDGKLADPKAYNFTPEQQVAFDTLIKPALERKDVLFTSNLEHPRTVTMDMESFDPEMEGTLAPSQPTLSRVVVEFPEQYKNLGVGPRTGVRPGAKQSAQFRRVFDTESEGWSKGYKYLTDLEHLMAINMALPYKAEANAQFRKGLIAEMAPETSGEARARLKEAHPDYDAGRIDQMVSSYMDKRRIDLPGMAGLAFDPQFAAEAKKMAGRSLEQWQKTLRTGSGILKTAKSSFDLAVSQLQLLPLLASSPIRPQNGAIWAKSTARSLRHMVSPEFVGNWMQRPENKPIIKELASMGYAIGERNEMFGASNFGTSSQGANIITKGMNYSGKGVEYATRPFSRQMSAALDMTIVELMKGLPADMPRIERFKMLRQFEAMTGRSRTASAGMGAQRQWVETMASFAASYYRSSIDALANVSEKGAAGVEARKHVAASLAGGVLLYGAIGQLVGMSWDDIERGLNPANPKDWMTWKYTRDNGDVVRFGPGGIYVSLVSMAGKTLAQVRDYPAKEWWSEWATPAMRWLRGHSSPAGGLAWDVVTQKNYAGEPLSWGGVARGVLPFSASQLVPKTGQPSADLVGAETFSQAAGLRGFTQTPWQMIRDRGRQFRLKEGVKFKTGVGPSEYVDLDWALRQNDPKSIRETYQRLANKGFSEERIGEYFDRKAKENFTGTSNKIEYKFLRSLSAEERKWYKQAVQENRSLLPRLERAIGKRLPRSGSTKSGIHGISSGLHGIRGLASE